MTARGGRLLLQTDGKTGAYGLFGGATAGVAVGADVADVSGSSVTFSGFGLKSFIEPSEASTAIPRTPPRTTLPAMPTAPPPLTSVWTVTVCGL